MKTRIRQLSEWILITILSLILLVIVLLAIAVYKASKTHVGIGVENRIELTPTQITAMKAIGEWEFLAISDEEMVDTVRRGLFSNDELVRIYYGTLRLGINMHKVQPRWIEQRADSLLVTLPPVELLDTDFIDEARTQSFYESGSWSTADMEALYRRAYSAMLSRCMSPQNIRSAEDNALTQFHQLMKSMGYNNVVIRFQAKNKSSQ